MKQFTVFDTESGRVMWSGWCHDDDFELQATGQPGASVVEGAHDVDAGRFVEGEFTPFPEKPVPGAEWARWDWAASAWVVDTAQAAADVRARRDALLAASDWTQGRDVSDAVAARWQPYRQALRDVTAQEGFPLEVAWPTPPA
jgi:hypothetical protein